MRYELNGKKLTEAEAIEYINSFPRTPFVPFEEQTFDAIRSKAHLMMFVYGVNTFTSRLNGLTFIKDEA